MVARLSSALAWLGVALIGALAGAFVAIVVVDYTDATASHSALDFAILGLCTLAGLAIAIWVARRSEGPDERRGRR